MAYVCEEGSGFPCDVSVGGTDITSMTTPWTTAAGIPSWNNEKGFYVAVAQTPPYIPALSDGSAAADGSAITNPGGFTHNGCEVSILQDSFGILPTVGSTVGDLSQVGVGTAEWSAFNESDDQILLTSTLPVDLTNVTIRVVASAANSPYKMLRNDVSAYMLNSVSGSGGAVNGQVGSPVTTVYVCSRIVSRG